MKRAAAFILSLTVIWLQMLASAQTLSASRAQIAEPECGCCVQKAVCRCCCVAPAAPDTKPRPATPVNPSAPVDFSALIPKHIAWLLPASPPALVHASAPTATVSAVPLFTRHCALLI